MKGGYEMKYRKVIFISLLLLLISLMCLYIFAQGIGYIQIKCELGVTVFLDNNFVGSTSSELGGLILQDVPAGSHQIKIVKEGFVPQSVKIDLKVDEIYVYEAEEFIPQSEVKEIVPCYVTFSVEAGNGTIEARADGNLISSGDLVEEGAKVIFKVTPDVGQIVRSWEVDGTKRDTITDSTYIIENLQSAIDFKVIFDVNLNKIGGKGPAGGWIFYDKGIYSDGWRFLEAAPASTEWTRKEWGSARILIGGTERGVGTGKDNTAIIVSWLNSHDETGCAAQLCDTLVYGGYSDWFLPSKDELYQMYTNLYLHEVGFNTYSSYAGYWSSSESPNAGIAWLLNFHSGGSGRGTKDNSHYRVRAARAF